MKKYLIEKLKALPQLFVRHSANRKVIETTNLSHAEFLWQKVYLPDGWDIEKPIKVVWSWRLKDYFYRFVVKRHCA